MVTYEQRAIQIKTNGGKQTSGNVQVALYDKQARLLRAVKILVLFWLLAVALFFTFIPGFHLLGSIALFILGPVFAFKRYNANFINEKADGQCPSCTNDIAIQFETDDRLPMWTYCPKCNAPIQLLLEKSSSG